MARVLILGAYGLIGAELARQLGQAGHDVTGMGRDPATARKVLPGLAWRFGDLRDLQKAADWAALIEGQDAVANAAGALQDGPEDALEAVHHHAIAALAEACAAAGVKLVQISAAGVSEEANTHFMRSKARGDVAVLASGGEAWVLRPGLVLARTGYGGTALLRMLAAVPWMQPMTLGKMPVQTVGVDDLAAAVLAVLSGEVPAGRAYDLVEAETHTLRDVVQAMRAWLGFRPAKLHLPLPRFLLWPVTAVSDGFGRLGWRGPLRRTAVKTLKGGVTGDPAPWAQTGAARPRPMAESLGAMPARSEDRLAARMALLMPFVLVTLGLFWLLSGVIGLLQAEAAAGILTQEGWPRWAALGSVIGFALADIALALALSVRRYARRALWGMILLSLAYLGFASLFTPALWADPLGPLLKVIPQIMLALVALPMLESR